MKPEQIVGLIVRCFAIYLFFGLTLNSVMSLGLIIENSTSDSFMMLVTYIGMIAAGIIVPLFLWLFPFTIARKLIPSAQSTTVKTNISFEQLESLAFSILGIWLIISALSIFLHKLINTLSMPHGAHNGSISFSHIIVYFFSEMSISLLYAAAGLLLLLKPQRVAGFLKRIRGGIN